MRIEPIDPIYKSTFNTKQNPNRKQDEKQKDKKDKKSKVYTDILEISADGRKRLREDRER